MARASLTCCCSPPSRVRNCSWRCRATTPRWPSKPSAASWKWFSRTTATRRRRADGRPGRAAAGSTRSRSGMDIKRGIPVSAGVAIGPALVLDTEWYRIPQRYVDPARVDAEIARLHLALRAAAGEARGHEKTIHDRLGRQYAAIFEAHALLIEDP